MRGRASPVMSFTVVAVDELMTVQDVCDVLKVSRSTFDKWRQRRVGPPATRLPNGQLRIRRSELNDWLRSQEITW